MIETVIQIITSAVADIIEMVNIEGKPLSVDEFASLVKQEMSSRDSEITADRAAEVKIMDG